MTVGSNNNKFKLLHHRRIRIMMSCFLKTACKNHLMRLLGQIITSAIGICVGLCGLLLYLMAVGVGYNLKLGQIFENWFKTTYAGSLWLSALLS